MDLQWSAVVAEAAARGMSSERELKQDRSRSRRAEILQGALRVFARDGIARARIADIAAEAGVPLSSVYDYFPNKEDIAYALPIAEMRAFYLEFIEKAGPLRSARARLAMFLWLTADFARRNQEWARTLYLEVWPSVLVEKSPVRQSLDDYGRIMMTLIHDGTRTGEWPVDKHPYETLTIFTGALNQMIITWLLYRNPRDLMKATGKMVDRLLTMLGAAPARSARANRSAPAP